MQRILTPMTPRSFRVAKMIGREDFAGAIAELEAGLRANPNDGYWLSLLAQCFSWSGCDDKAIETAHRIVQIDSRDFNALKLLGEIYVKRDDRDNAALFVRRALENYPKPTPSVSPLFLRTIRRIAKVVPLFRRIKDSDYQFLADIDSSNREWFDWAKRYLSWHDGVTGDKSSPIVH